MYAQSEATRTRAGGYAGRGDITHALVVGVLDVLEAEELHCVLGDLCALVRPHCGDRIRGELNLREHRAVTNRARNTSSHIDEYRTMVMHGKGAAQRAL